MTIRASYLLNSANEISGVAVRGFEPPLLVGPLGQTARAAMIRERAMTAIIRGMTRVGQLIDGPPTAQQAGELQATAIQLARRLAARTCAAWWILHEAEVMNPMLALDRILNSD